MRHNWKTDQIQLYIYPKPPFDFRSTVYSSGWIELAPTAWDEERAIVQRAERLNTRKVVLLELSDEGSVKDPIVGITITHQEQLTQDEQNEIKATVRYALRIDEDLSEFYKLCQQQGGYWSEVTNGKGRLLRSPSLFEDVVKTICTTNIQWGGTKRMVKELVDAYGEVYPGDSIIRAFPTPTAIANVPSQVFADSVKLGYRTDYVYLLAQKVASGDLDLETFKNTDLPTPELKKELLAIKGIGDYAAATLLMLLGHYDELAVDTAFRQFVSKKYFKGERPSDAEAQAIYDDWGEWKYLAYWFDIWQEYSSN